MGFLLLSYEYCAVGTNGHERGRRHKLDAMLPALVRLFSAFASGPSDSHKPLYYNNLPMPQPRSGDLQPDIASSFTWYGARYAAYSWQECP